MKRLISVILTICMLFALALPLCFTAGAEGDVVEIGTAAELISFGKNFGSYSGKTVKLTADIDMSGQTWSPTGTAFAGTLDGNGHKISNLTSTNSATADFGFIPKTDAGAIICNLTFDNIKITQNCTTKFLGGLIGYHNSGSLTVQNVHLQNAELTCTNKGAGGLIGAVGVADITVSHCSFDGTVSGKAQTGGILGNTYGALTLEGCNVNGSIQGTEQVGGLVGVRSLTNNKQDMNLLDCVVAATVSGATNTGGLVGQSKVVTKAVRCVVTSAGITSNTGAFVGYAEQNVIMKECFTTSIASTDVNAVNLADGKTLEAIDCYLVEDTNVSFDKKTSTSNIISVTKDQLSDITDPEISELDLTGDWTVTDGIILPTGGAHRDASVSMLGYQLRKNSDATYDVRFCAYINGTDYRGAGMLISMDGDAPVELAATHVYESINEKLGDSANALSVNDYGYANGYFMAIVITGVPSGEEHTFSAVPFVDTNEDVRVYGFSGETKALGTCAAELGALILSELGLDASTPVTDLANGNVEIATNASIDTLSAKLSGYTSVVSNEIGENVYRAYTNEQYMIYLYAVNGTTRVIASRIEDARLPENFVEQSVSGTVDPKLAVLNMDYENQPAQDNGMGLIFTLADGSYLIYDGGYNANDAVKLYNYLTANNQRADGKLVIDGWFITHGHDDHYGAPAQFMTLYNDKVTVNGFYYNPVINAEERDPLVTLGNELVKNFEGSRLYTVHTGMKLYFQNMQVEILYTHEDHQPNELTTLNDASVVSRVNVSGGKSVLVTGDIQDMATYKPSEMLVNVYGDSLKSDILQVPHHGDSGGTEALYQAIRPSHAVYCTSNTKFEKLKTGHNSQYAPNAALLEIVGVNYTVADGEVQIIDLK